jgi:hypothetical protein
MTLLSSGLRYLPGYGGSKSSSSVRRPTVLPQQHGGGPLHEGSVSLTNITKCVTCLIGPRTELGVDTLIVYAGPNANSALFTKFMCEVLSPFAVRTIRTKYITIQTVPHMKHVMSPIQSPTG